MSHSIRTAHEALQEYGSITDLGALSYQVSPSWYGQLRLIREWLVLGFVLSSRLGLLMNGGRDEMHMAQVGDRVRQRRLLAVVPDVPRAVHVRQKELDRVPTCSGVDLAGR